MKLDVRDPKWDGLSRRLFDATGAEINNVVAFDTETGEVTHQKLDPHGHPMIDNDERLLYVATYPAPLQVVGYIYKGLNKKPIDGRLKDFFISGSLVLEILNGRACRAVGLPHDATVYACRPADTRYQGGMFFTIHSVEFEEVPDGQMIPELDLTLHVGK